ncbi:carbamoyl-phosphate synthase large chain [Vibrio sp. JCM 19236]|nr:carbamoyl-phosphate synthase large chain [Vibrio sp. JCM 19236]
MNYTTTLNAAFAACMSHTADAKSSVTSVQELHAKVKSSLA